MDVLTESELSRSFKLWVIKSERADHDHRLKPFLSNEIKPWKLSQGDWLKQTRTGLLLSAVAIAKKLGVSHSTYNQYEENEASGTITLATLAKVAEVMDCELVYAIRPKSQKLISTLIWERLLPAALAHPWLKKCDQRRRSHALLFIATRYLRDAKFRKKQGWSLRKNK